MHEIVTVFQAYGSARISQGQVQQILTWPGSFETFRKIPTCLLYDESGRVLAWGLEAKNASPMPGTVRCEWHVVALCVIDDMTKVLQVQALLGTSRVA